MPAGGSSVEASLGSRAFVWIGTVALALAGVFLVKYTFEKGLLGPTARVTLGVAFGTLLLGSGEWIRVRSARVAQGLSAAGIAVLFAAFLAGVNLYHLMPRAVGFALLALTTATAVLLSLRHGVLIALLGLVGGFLTPALIGAEEANAAGLFSYLFLVQVGLLVVARRRRWWASGGTHPAGQHGLGGHLDPRCRRTVTGRAAPRSLPPGFRGRLRRGRPPRGLRTRPG